MGGWTNNDISCHQATIRQQLVKLNLNKDKECDCDIFGEAVWLEVIDLYKEEKPYHVEG